MDDGMDLSRGAQIKVVGVGGGGCNAVDRMIAANVHGVEFVALNTDAQALGKSKSPVRMCIGEKVTRGLGTGGVPNLGEKAATAAAASRSVNTSARASTVRLRRERAALGEPMSEAILRQVFSFWG